MYNYPKRRNNPYAGTLVFLGIFIVLLAVTFGPLMLIGSLHLTADQTQSILIFVVAMFTLLHVSLPFIRHYFDAYRSRVRGKLEVVDNYAAQYQFLTRRHWQDASGDSNDCLEKVLAALKETNIACMPLARSVWKIEEVDREKFSARLVLYLHDPCKANRYVRQLHLTVHAFPGRQCNAVHSEYEIPTPGMLKLAKRAIEETEAVMAESLKKVSNTSAAAGFPTLPPAEPYTIFNDYTYSH